MGVDSLANTAYGDLTSFNPYSYCNVIIGLVTWTCFLSRSVFSVDVFGGMTGSIPLSDFVPLIKA